MTVKELYGKNLDTAVVELSEQYDCITTDEALRDHAKYCIDDDNLFLAIHVLEAMRNSPASYYNYDYCMGTLENPTPISGLCDLEDFCEEENDNETI